MKTHKLPLILVALLLVIAVPLWAEQQALEVSLYPNPSQGKFRIELEVEDPGKVRARIYDMTGKLVKDLGEELKLQDKSIRLEVQLKDPIPGIYFLKLESDKQKATKKIIIR